MKTRGYPLPAGDAYTEDLECMILFYPNKVEYRRALFGSLDYLATWIAWENDPEKKGQDAAESWKAAVQATRDCIEMATCDTILELLVQIEKNTRTCCGESNYVSYNENTIITTVIIPGSGPAPATYGETAVADWDEWLEYVCYHAHRYVDDLIDTAEKLDLALSVGGYLLDFVAHLFSLVQWRMVEDIIPVNFSVIQAIFNALGQGLIQNEFATLAVDFETHRQDIVCALIDGTSLGDAVEDIVGSGILWTTYYQWLDYDTTQAIIYEGGIPEIGYLTPIKRADCSCIFEPTPPTGYEWVHPGQGSYFWTTNIGSHTEDYNASTGVLTISVTSGGGDQLEYGLSFADIGSPLDDPFEHAYCFELISSNVPTTIDVLYNLEMRVTPSQGRDGYLYGGYNTLLHSGAEWDAMNAEFTVAQNYAAYHQDRLRMVEDPNKSAQSSSVYVFTVRVWGLAQV